MAHTRIHIKQKGQVALPFMLLIGSILIEIAIAGALMMYFFGSSRLAERLYARAGAVANTGIKNAIMNISRDKDFVPTATCLPTSTITTNSDTASVVVCKTDTSGVESYIYTISSLGIAGGRQKKIEATVDVNKITGKVEVNSITEKQID
jgi:uncharacterized protein (UPF0333 family)